MPKGHPSGSQVHHVTGLWPPWSRQNQCLYELLRIDNVHHVIGIWPPTKAPWNRQDQCLGELLRIGSVHMIAKAAICLNVNSH